MVTFDPRVFKLNVPALSEPGSQPLRSSPSRNRIQRSTQSLPITPLTSVPSSSIGCAESSLSDILPQAASGTSTADITRRFGSLLEAMRAAGFQDFDSMAAAYYTAKFESGSFPAMVQCASRSRRLKSMLLELRESSSKWPRWESRGFHECVSEVAGESGWLISLLSHHSCFEEVTNRDSQHPSVWKRWSVWKRRKDLIPIEVSQQVLSPPLSGCSGIMGAAYRAVTSAVKVRQRK